MPFENIGGNPEQGYLADGLTADLVTDLTRFQTMHVVSPHRAFRQFRRGLPETPWSAPSPPPAAVLSGQRQRPSRRQWFFRDPAIPQRLLAAFRACGLRER